MAKGIAINFLADVKDFLRGTKNVEEELDDVADALDDVAKEGEQATEKLEKSFKEMAKEASRAGREAGDGIGDNLKKTAKIGEEASGEIKDEFKSNLSEVTSSFNGSVESMGDLVQGTLGGLVGGLGPVGQAAGAAGAVGVGLIIASLVQAEEQSEAARQRITELGLAMIEAGTEGEVPLDIIVNNLKAIITNGDEARKKFRDIQTETKGLEISATGIAEAYAGNTEALDEQLDVYDELIEGEKTRQEEIEKTSAQQVRSSGFQVSELEAQRNALEQVKIETEAAAKAEQDWLASGGAEYLAKQDAIAQIDAAYDEAVYSVDDFLNAETGVYDLEAYAASIEERGRLLDEYQSRLAESGLTTEQKAGLNELGVEQANAILIGLSDPTVSNKTKETIKKGLGEASKEGSGQAEKEIKKAFEKPISAQVKVQADIVPAQRDIDNLVKARTAIIKLDFQDRYGKRVY